MQALMGSRARRKNNYNIQPDASTRPDVERFVAAQANVSQASTCLHATERRWQGSSCQFVGAPGKTRDERSADSARSIGDGCEKGRKGSITLTSSAPRAPVAQGIEHPPPKRGAASSILAGRATFAALIDTGLIRR